MDIELESKKWSNPRHDQDVPAGGKDEERKNFAQKANNIFYTEKKVTLKHPW